MRLLVVLVCVAFLGTYAAAVGDWKLGAACWGVILVWPFVS